MDPAKTTAAARVSPPWPMAVAFPEPDTLVLSPTALLPNNVTFTLSVDTNATAVNGQHLVAPFTSSFTTTPHPSVSLSSPAPDAQDVLLDAVIVLEFSAPMDTTALVPALTLDPPLSPPHLSLAWSSDNSVVSISHPDALFPPSTRVSLNVSTAAVSAAGASLDAPLTAFFTTVTPPSVLSVYPGNGANGVAPSETVIVTFSTAMNTASVSAAFSLTGGPAGSPPANVSGSISWLKSGTVLVFTPDALLSKGATYTATVAANAVDLAGTPLYHTVSSTFSVAAAPVISASSPANGTTGVSIFDSLSLTFSEPMAPEATAASFFLIPHAETACAMSAGNTVLVCIPSNGLVPSRSYTMGVGPTAVSLAGDHVAGPSSIVFATEGAPVVASVTPAADSHDVPVTTDVVVVFTTPMNVASTRAAFSIIHIATGVSPPGSVSFSADTSTLTWTLAPDTELASLSDYSILVGEGAESNAGTPLSPGSFSSNFSTVMVPQLVDSTPADGAYDLPAGSGQHLVFVLEFDVPMDQSSVSSATSVSARNATGALLPPLDGTYTSWTNGGATARWTSSTPMPPEATYTLTIGTDAVDVSGVHLASPVTVTVSTTGVPVVVSTTPPAHDSAADPTAPVVIVFNMAMDVDATTPQISLVVGSNSSDPVAGVGPPVWSSGNTVATLGLPPGGLPHGAVFTLLVGGSSKAATGAVLRSAVTAPWVTWVTPYVKYVAPVSTSGSDVYPRTASLTVVFTEPMNPATVDLGSGLRCLSHPDVFSKHNASASWAQANSLLLVSFGDGELLDSGANYTFTLDAAIVTSSGGAPLPFSTTWWFETATTPQVVSVDPANNADSVGLDPTLTMVFSVAMAPSSVVAGFTVANAVTQVPVHGYTRFSTSDDTTLLWTPLAPLDPGTTYAVTLAEGVLSQVGAPTRALFRSVFTVTGLPQLVRVTPADGSTNVPISTIIVLAFSRPMDLSSTVAAVSITPPTELDAKWSNNQATLSFAPAAGVGLARDVLYTVTVADTARGTNGLNMTGGGTFTFVTSRLDPYAPCAAASGSSCGACQYVSTSCAYNVSSGECYVGEARAVCPLSSTSCFDKYRTAPAIGYGVGAGAVGLAIVAIAGATALGMPRTTEIVAAATYVAGLAFTLAALTVKQWWSSRIDGGDGSVALLVVLGLFSGETVVSDAGAVGSTGCAAHTVPWSELETKYQRGGYIAGSGLVGALVVSLGASILALLVKRESGSAFSFATDSAERLRKRATPWLFATASFLALTGTLVWMLTAPSGSGSFGLSMPLAFTAAVLYTLAGLGVYLAWLPSERGYIEMGDALLELDPEVHYASKWST